MPKKKFYIYVKRLGTDTIAEKVEVQDKHLTPGMLDRIVTGIQRHMDMDRFTVDDDAAQKEALRRSTSKGKT